MEKRCKLVSSAQRLPNIKRLGDAPLAMSRLRTLSQNGYGTELLSSLEGRIS
jgi:hypothetical protein